MGEVFFKIKKDDYINVRHIVRIKVSCAYTMLIDKFGNSITTKEDIHFVLKRLGVPVTSKKVAIKRKS